MTPAGTIGPERCRNFDALSGAFLSDVHTVGSGTGLKSSCFPKDTGERREITCCWTRGVWRILGNWSQEKRMLNIQIENKLGTWRMLYRVEGSGVVRFCGGVLGGKIHGHSVSPGLGLRRISDLGAEGTVEARAWGMRVTER